MLLIRAYHRARGDTKRTRGADSRLGARHQPRHGGHVRLHHASTIPSDAARQRGPATIKEEVDETTVGLMLTNPNTLGLFEQEILEVTKAIHDAGGLVYGDGANLNAILGAVKPADLGFDVLHINIHKTFSTPHGGGAPT